MQTAAHAIQKTTPSTRIPGIQDAITLLLADHNVIMRLFREYDKTLSIASKKKLVAQICTELSVHAQVEEEIFYPAVNAALQDIKDKALVSEAITEHAALKELIAQVEGMQPDGELFDAKIQYMSEDVKNHIKEEQNEMFPNARATRLDLHALGTELAKRKAELLAARA